VEGLAARFGFGGQPMCNSTPSTASSKHYVRAVAARTPHQAFSHGAEKSHGITVSLRARPVACESSGDLMPLVGPYQGRLRISPVCFQCVQLSDLAYISSGSISSSTSLSTSPLALAELSSPGRSQLRRCSPSLASGRHGHCFVLLVGFTPVACAVLPGSAFRIPITST
jgi:hypothetical protein